MSNYRPVSNLSFMSKLIERAIAIQLNDYLVANNLLPRHQSAYRKGHSTEMAMLRVWSDFLAAARYTVGTVGPFSRIRLCRPHSILLQRLHSVFGLTDVVLQWMESFLSDRTQQVAFNGQLSVTTGAVWSSAWICVRSAALYVLYTAELAKVVSRCTSKPTTSIFTLTR